MWRRLGAVGVAIAAACCWPLPTSGQVPSPMTATVAGRPLVARPLCSSMRTDMSRCQAEIFVDPRTGSPRIPAPRSLRLQAVDRRTKPLAISSAASPTTQPSEGLHLLEPQFRSPASILQAYDLGPLASTAGTGKTVALVELGGDPYAESDLNTYRSFYGLPPCTKTNGCFTRVDQDGGANYPPVSEGTTEPSLDMDAVSTVCPNCKILLVETGDSVVAAQATAARLGASVISDSWISFSPGRIYETFNFPHIATVSSSGDGGYFAVPSEYASYGPVPDVLPNVTSAGGTHLVTTEESGIASARGYTEGAWSDSGSTCAASIAKPSWQADSGCATRTDSDVSAIANGIFVYDTGSGGWTVIGGTSLSAPLIASFYALTGVPDENPSWMYLTASTLNDIDEGTNGTCAPLAPYLCASGLGYDGPTGIGSISGSVVRGAPGIAGPSRPDGTYVREATTDGAGNVSVKLEAGVYPNGLSTQYWWEYGLADGEKETSSDEVAASCSIATTSATVAPLKPNQTYWFRLVAENALGRSYGYDWHISTALGELPQAHEALPNAAAVACPSPSPLPNAPNPIPPATATSAPAPMPSGVLSSRTPKPAVSLDRFTKHKGTLGINIRCHGSSGQVCMVRIRVWSGRKHIWRTVRVSAGHVKNIRVKTARFGVHVRFLHVAIFLSSSDAKYSLVLTRTVRPQ